MREQTGRMINGRYIDDYDLIDEDFDYFIKLGLEEMKWQEDNKHDS